VRFAGRMVLGTILVLVFAMVVLVWNAERTLRGDLLDQTLQDLERQARLVRAALGPDSAAWQAEAHEFGAPGDIRITVIARDGTVLADSDLPMRTLASIDNHAERPEVREALAGRIGRAVRVSAIVRESQVYVAVPAPMGALRVSIPADRVDQPLRRSLRAVLLAAVLALVVGSGLAFVAARSVSRPLRGLAGAARAIAAGTLPRFPRSGVPEIDGLVVSLREMHRQLEDRFADLRREQSETAALVSSMVEGVLAADSRGRILTANPAARHLLGYQPEDGLPDLPALFKDKEARGMVESVLRGEEVTREIDLDGTTLLVSARPLPGGGAVIVMHDLTDLRRLEQIRRDFVANVSHELKTPLTSIAGYTETLLHEVPDPETGRKFLATIQANAQRMQRLVDDLLDLSRIESGHWQPKIETVPVEAVAREEWARLAAKAGPDRILRVEVEPDTTLRADAEAIRQIFTNLLDNAIRHTAADGEVVCRAEPMDGGVSVSVADNGSGILSTHLPRIFERFYRADAARSREEGGTGLGLSIVKHLVEAHGGRVRARSQRGAGTTVTCWFPG